MTGATEEVPSIQILDTRVHIVQIPEVMAHMAHWIEDEPHRRHHVVNTGMHGIMEAHKDPAFKSVLNSADLLAPDGILAILVARIHGYRIQKRETGPGLLWRFSEIASLKGYKYFFFGDTEDTLKQLSDKLISAFPRLQIAGYYSPPFRSITPQEDAAIVDMINQAKPDVLWVGLGMPRQETWIFDHKDSLNAPVMVGAGASLKFSSGRMSRAPKLVCNLGFEWLWRLLQEPRRVWRRVFIDAPQFIVLVLLQLSGIRKFE